MVFIFSEEKKHNNYHFDESLLPHQNYLDMRYEITRIIITSNSSGGERLICEDN